MALYFLSYDLRNERDCQILYDELDKHHAVRVLESDWCFKYLLNGASERLRDHFKAFIDKNDEIIVSEVCDWASYNVDSSPNALK